jgi:hypothetical protein
VLRAYKSLDGLTPITRPAEAPKLRKGFEWREHPSEPEYCLQINSEEKAGVFWGAGGSFLDIQFF